MHAPSLAAVIALVASRSLVVDSASTAGQPWLWRERSADASDLSVSFAATTNSSSPDSWALSVSYEGSNCTGSAVAVLADAGCSPDEDVRDCAVADHFGSSSKEDDIPEVDSLFLCATDLPSQLDQLFGNQTYLRIDFFDSQNCSQFDTTNAYVADDKCHAQIMTDGKTKKAIVIAQRSTVSADGTASTRFFNTTDCSGEPMHTYSFNKAQLTSNECANGLIAYTNADLGDSDSGSEHSDGAGSLAVGAIVGLVAACGALLL